LRNLGVERTYKPQSLIKNPQWNFNDYLKLAVTYGMVNNPEFAFLQIGAFDGVNNDPLNDLIKKHDLKGIVVEPQPQAFDLLKENYKSTNNLVFVNAAISNKDETKPFYTTKTEAIQVASFNKQHLIKRNVPVTHIAEVEMQCFTINTLLEQNNFSSLDLIQIDTEGYDFEIVKTIDFTKVQPLVIRYEHEHLSPSDFSNSLELLADQGYQFIVERRDVVAIRA